MTGYEKIKNYTFEQMRDFLVCERMCLVTAICDALGYTVPDDMKERIEDTYQQVLATDIENDTAWKIWLRYYDHKGEFIGMGVYPKNYAHKSSATRRAKQLWGKHGENRLVEWAVAKTNPFIKEKENDQT